MIRPLRSSSQPFSPALSSQESHASAQPSQAGLGLDGLRNTGEVKIESLQGPDSLKRRLMEIGFVPGSAVQFVMATPFGDPLIYSLRGCKIALRRNEARCIRYLG